MLTCIVTKSFQPEAKVKTFSKILIGTVSRICETKCHSLRKKEIKVDEGFIPRWEDSPYCSLASEWDILFGLCENWNLKLKWAKPLEGFPGSSAGKESTCNEGNLGSSPALGKIPWRRERLPTPVFWPGEFHGLYSPWGCKESDTTEWLSLSHVYLCICFFRTYHPQNQQKFHKHSLTPRLLALVSAALQYAFPSWPVLPCL